jgi:indole-3-glycerol phosphate synthase
MAAALRGDRIRIIAEVKKASPSKGLICAEFDPIRIARTYAENQAAAISVLTDNKYFQGSIDYLNDINHALGPGRPPLLRKDFIIDPYQIYETRAYGADALLLIVAVLTARELKLLLDLSRQLQLNCLVEIHTESEINTALQAGASIIGINNRDLRTFQVDFSTTERLRPLIPSDKIVVSESGIRNHSDMQKLQELGVQAALIGETLMTAQDITLKMRELL